MLIEYYKYTIPLMPLVIIPLMPLLIIPLMPHRAVSLVVINIKILRYLQINNAI